MYAAGFLDVVLALPHPQSTHPKSRLYQTHPAQRSPSQTHRHTNEHPVFRPSLHTLRLRNRSRSTLTHTLEQVKPSATPSECSFNGGCADDLHAPSPNLYRDLMQKYEAVLEVQRLTIPRSRLLSNSGLVTITSIPPDQQLDDGDGVDAVAEQTMTSTTSTTTTAGSSADASTVSVHDHAVDLNSSASTTDTAPDAATRPNRAQSARSARTPTADFSEAETSSSGFADETSNRHTQTDETLCACGTGLAGLDAMDGRFRTRPEYRDLFQEIFAILRKAADNKDAGEQLPLLDVEEEADVDFDDDDDEDVTVAATLPDGAAAAAAYAAAAAAQYCDDTESVASSVMSEQSVAMSERITKQERRTIIQTVKKACEKNAAASAAAAAAAARATAAAVASATAAVCGQENIEPSAEGAAPTTAAAATSTPTATAAAAASNSGVATPAVVDKDGRVLMPFKRDQLEYLSISVTARKKSRRKTRTSSNSSGGAAATMGSMGSIDSPVLPSPPRVFYTSSGKKRRDMRSATIASAAAAVETARLQAAAAAGNAASGSGGVGSEPWKSPNIKWDGTSMTVYNRTYMQQQAAGAGSSSTSGSTSAAAAAAAEAKTQRRTDFKRTSAASQSLHKLFELDLSYAEVLRRADSSKVMLAQQHQNLQLQHQQQLQQQKQQQQRQRKY